MNSTQLSEARLAPRLYSQSSCQLYSVGGLKPNSFAGNWRRKSVSNPGINLDWVWGDSSLRTRLDEIHVRHLQNGQLMLKQKLHLFNDVQRTDPDKSILSVLFQMSNW